MKNQQLAQIFYEIAEFLKIEEVAFKPYAYQKAAGILENLEKDIEEIYNKGGIKELEEISGIGKSIARKIEEFLKTGKIKYHQQLKKKIPVDIEGLTSIEGVGPRTVKTLYQKLGVKNIKDLEKKAQEHKIAPLFDFGEKTEKNILEGIAFLKRSKGRFLLGEILPVAQKIEDELKKLKEVDQISIAGSVRRRKETVGDVDFLITTKNPEKVMNFFVSLPGVIKVWGKGRTKSSIRMEQGFDIDLRVVDKKSYGSALQYFTGSKEHNIATRRIAIRKGLKLNEYGVFKDKKIIAGWSEEDIYRALDLDWIEPELRENRGEVKLASRGKLPELIKLKDIKGDLHCHSDWDGGVNSIKEMAKEAIGRGYKYLGISDHTKFLKIEHGLNEKKLTEQREEIDKLNQDFKKQEIDFYIFQGAETNILKDGSIDIKDDALKKLDYVIAGVHSGLKMSKLEMTRRIIKAMKNPYVKIISHPTGRILKKRDEYQIDLDEILKVAQEFDIVLEVNASPSRLDLNDINIKKAIESGVKLSINTDAHRKDQLSHMNLGVFQARRGWAKKENVINVYTTEFLLKLWSVV